MKMLVMQKHMDSTLALSSYSGVATIILYLAKLNCFEKQTESTLKEEHFLTVLHVKSTDAETISSALTSFISENNRDYGGWLDKGMMERPHSLV